MLLRPGRRSWRVITRSRPGYTGPIPPVTRLTATRVSPGHIDGIREATREIWGDPDPYDYTAGPAWLPYSTPRKIYLTAGTYEWSVEIYTTWSLGITLGAFRNIYLKSNWYYWRCYVKTVEVDDLGDTGASNYCSLTPTDGSTPTAYLVDSDTSAWAVEGAGAGVSGGGAARSPVARARQPRACRE